MKVKYIIRTFIALCIVLMLNFGLWFIHTRIIAGVLKANSELILHHTAASHLKIETSYQDIGYHSFLAWNARGKVNDFTISIATLQDPRQKLRNEEPGELKIFFDQIDIISKPLSRKIEFRAGSEIKFEYKHGETSNSWIMEFSEPVTYEFTGKKFITSFAKYISEGKILELLDNTELSYGPGKIVAASPEEAKGLVETFGDGIMSLNQNNFKFRLNGLDLYFMEEFTRFDYTMLKNVMREVRQEYIKENGSWDISLDLEFTDELVKVMTHTPIRPVKTLDLTVQDKITKLDLIYSEQGDGPVVRWTGYEAFFRSIFQLMEKLGKISTEDQTRFESFLSQLKTLESNGNGIITFDRNNYMQFVHIAAESFKKSNGN